MNDIKLDHEEQEIVRLRAEIERLLADRANRYYWEGRYRDKANENDRLRAENKRLQNAGDDMSMDNESLMQWNLELRAELEAQRAELADQDRRRLFTLRELGLEEIERLRMENAAFRLALEPKS